MRAAADAAALLDALTRIAPASDARPTIPMYSHVLISAGGDLLTLETFDGYLAARIRLAAEVEAAGELLADLALLRKWLKGVDGDVAILHADNQLKLSGRKPKPRRLKLSTLPAQDWPRQSFEGGTSLGKLEVLGPQLAQLFPAAATFKDARDYLRGVSVNAEGWAATDGNRIHWIDAPASEVLIIPRDHCQIICGAAETGGGELFGAVNSWRLKAGDLELKGPTVYGTYPDWRRILNTEPTTPAFTAYVADIVDAVRSAALGSRSAIIIEMRAGDDEGQFELAVRSTGRADGKVGFEGLSETVCAAFDVEVSKFRAALHSPLVLDALEAFNSDQVLFEVSGGDVPRVKLRAPDQDLDPFNALIMGMRY